MGFFYVFLIFVFLIIILQLTIKAKVIFNIKNNIGRFQVSFLKIKIFDYILSIESGCIKLTNKKKKNKYIPLEFDSQSIQEYTVFQDVLFRKIYFKQLGFYFNFGIESSAFCSAMTCGYVDIFAKIFYEIFKTKKSETKFLIKVYPNFNKSVIKIGFKAKISLSLFDLFWTFIETKTKNFFNNREK